MLEELLTSSEYLVIKAFTKVARDSDSFSLEEGQTFSALVNPESITRSYGQAFQKTGGINTSGQRARYSKSLPQQLQLQIILDDTGATTTGLAVGPFSTNKSVDQQVEDFRQLCYDYQGEIHEPQFLKLTWGKLSFNCRLLSFDVTFSLFDKGGKPFRAELDAIFLEDLSDEDRTKKENKQSPDITHTKMVQAGDTLPILTRKVYGDSTYYLKLAAFNGLDHFRELQAGMELRFPPLPELKKMGGTSEST